MDDCEHSYASYCPDCDAYFFEGEYGFDSDICVECGEGNCFEIT